MFINCAPPVTSAANALESSLGSKKVVMATDGAWNVGTFLGPSADFDYGVGVLPYMKEKLQSVLADQTWYSHHRAS